MLLVVADALLTDRRTEGCRPLREGVFEGFLIEACKGRGVFLADRSTLPGVKPNENPKSTLLTLRALHLCQSAMYFSSIQMTKQTLHRVAASVVALAVKEEPFSAKHAPPSRLRNATSNAYLTMQCDDGCLSEHSVDILNSIENSAELSAA
jgi:hypothetical protein